MPLRAHLRELRGRSVKIAIGLALAAVLGWFVYPQVFAALQSPILDVMSERGRTVTLNFPGVAASLDMKIKVSLFTGALVSSPWWIYQLWAFITPGLTRRERRYSLAFLGAAAPLFLAGAALAWWVMPMAVNLLTDFTPPGAVNLIDAQGYLTFVMHMVLAFGAAFLLPVIMVGLNLVGLVRAATWLRGWRWAVLLAFVFAAVATPTSDAVSLFALAVPLCALYFAAVALCALHDRRSDKARTAQGFGHGPPAMPAEDRPGAR